MPERIQRKRTAGWKAPEGSIYVGRPTKWGNPFKVGENVMWFPALANVDEPYPLPTYRPVGEYEHSITVVSTTAEDSVLWYGRYLNNVLALPENRDRDFFAPLRGKDLSCWCPLNQPCHADVLLRIANPPAEDGSR